MFTWMWIFEIVLWCGAVGRWSAHAAQPPGANTTCEEFERGAHFNPYQIIDSMWKIVYFWGDHSELYPVIFALPAKKRLLKFKETIDAIDPNLGVEWDHAALFMNPRPGTEVLFIYGGTPGAFRAVITKEQRQNKVRPYPLPEMKFADVRMKMVDSYLGMMCCEDLSAYVLARLNYLPLTETHCEEVAKRIGFRGGKGRSYLYLKKMIEDEL